MQLTLIFGGHSPTAGCRAVTQQTIVIENAVASSNEPADVGQVSSIYVR